ncbi:glycosyltransferase family 87 protein [Terriglobus sp.]|uniref:glycosyltransferase family 87 protein n=1 Tax=Terriglobus sp. TaxID=1889013 RepID=UPI003AFFAC34
MFLLISALLTCAAMLFSSVTRMFHWGLPYSFPYFFVPGQLLSDFRFFWTKFAYFPTYDFYSGRAGYFMYPLPLFYLLRPLFATSRPFILFLVILFVLSAILAYVFARAMKSTGMAGTTLLLFVTGTILLSYPMAFEYLRGNVEIVLFSLTAFGLIAWWRQKPYLAALLFGVAGACKIYPLILVGLLFSERRWRAVGLAFLTAIAVTLASAWAFGPTVHDALAWNGFQLGLFQKRYAGIPSQLGYDHSFFGLIKFVTLPWHPVLTWAVPIYVRTAALLSLVLYFLRIRHLPRLNQVLILSILSVTLPPVSYDYTLLALYPPLVLLSMEITRRAYAGVAPFPYALRYFALFGVLLTPLSFLTWYSNPHHAQARCVCLIVILWTALRHPIPEIVKSPTPGLLVEQSAGA